MIENACHANSGGFFVKMLVKKLFYIDMQKRIEYFRSQIYLVIVCPCNSGGKIRWGQGQASTCSRIIRVFLPVSLYRCTYRETYHR